MNGHLKDLEASPLLQVYVIWKNTSHSFKPHQNKFNIYCLLYSAVNSI